VIAMAVCGRMRLLLTVHAQEMAELSDAKHVDIPKTRLLRV
jgi:hypothetical protein